MKKCPLPINKTDIDVAKQLSELDGFVSDKQYKQLVVWLRDVNWPVFPYVAHFLVIKGVDASNGLWYALKSNKGTWKKNVVQYVLSQCPKSDLKKCSAWLPNYVTDPDIFGPDLATIEILIGSDMVELSWLEGWLNFKKKIGCQIVRSRSLA
ncbi:MAG: DUF5071 domain-containing protein [Candidatus Thiodiazotropha sp. (ex Lucinoma borealis)]|nr:DUF5071 domain-containing protein [Candidatus Thiodiazotropha sp. (ex Lucinoma borealis)]